MLTNQIRDAYYRQNECLTIVTGFCMVAASIPEGSSAMEDLVSLFTPFVQKQDRWTDADKRALVDAIRLYYQRRAPDAHVAPLAVAARPVLARRGGGWVRKALQGLLTLVLAAGCVALLMWGAMHLLDVPANAPQNCTAAPVVHKKFQKMHHIQTRMHALHGGKPVVRPKSQDRNTLLARIAAEEMYLNAKKLARNSTYTETNAPFGGSWSPISLVYQAAKWVTMSASAVSLVIVMYSIVQIRRQGVVYHPEP